MAKLFLYTSYNLLFNLTLLMFLFIGIQNSKDKQKVNYLIFESIELPISFIVGSSFVAGSLFGNIIFMFSKAKEIQKK